jgi:FMN phosphatase YigB (HAD superfamily)
MASVYSFDVFDTALVRRTAFPSDVFRLIGQRIAKEISCPAPREFVEDFVAARIQAEKTALAEREETTLDAIWTILRKSLPNLLPGCGPQYELDAEREVLAPNMALAERIACARAAGKRIIFLSDTYLPAEFIHSELLRHGLAAEGDGLYASSAVGVTKRTGALYSAVLKSEKIAAVELLHHGDNPHSDVDVPRRFGISATLLAEAHLNDWERAVVDCETAPKKAAARLAGAMRTFRLNASPEFNADARDLVATFLGPAVTVWAAWVLAAARRDGVRRLYFAARDGHLVWRAARVLAPRFGNIDCRYLKISRQSVLLPAVEEISRDGIPWLLRWWEVPQLERLIQKLGLAWHEVAHEFSAIAKDEASSKQLKTDEEWTEFWAVLQKPALNALLTARIADRRKAALAYFAAEGLGDDLPIGVADMGWYLTVQTALQKLVGWLRAAPMRSAPNAEETHAPDEATSAIPGNAHFALRGYYLGLEPNRNSPMVAGPSTSLFYNNPPDRSTLVSPRAIFRWVTLLEHVLGLAAHGTIREYRFAGAHAEPVCAAVPPHYAKVVDEIARAVEAFCADCLEPELYSEQSSAQALLDALIGSWFARPSPASLTILDQVEISDDPNNIGAELMIRPYRLADGLKALLPGRLRRALNLPLPLPFWREASLRVSKPWPQRLMRLGSRIDRTLAAIRRTLS